MNNIDIAQSRKADAARRQLGTALHLWLADLDPVSVHALACGGGEIADALAIRAQGTPLSSFMKEDSGLTSSELAGLRNRLWNALKHANDKKGNERDDESLLTTPLEEENEAQLCIGWFDLSQIGIPLPIEAQVFNLWSLAKRGDHDQLDDWPDTLFPGLQALPPEQQKAMLRRAIAEHRSNAEVMKSPQTDQRPLILPA